LDAIKTHLTRLKPLQAAVVKSDGGERCSQTSGEGFRRVRLRRRAQANRCRSVESGLGDVRTGG
jgi:hypothetical protein